MLTRLARPILVKRSKTALAAHADVEQSQRRVLKWLLAMGAKTEWGRRHGFDKMAPSWEEFRDAVDVTPYDTLRPLVMRMVAGERDLLWPGVTRNFAQSSGTSDGKSKYIPITDHSLRLNHYPGATDAVAHYLSHHPESRIFDGRAFILGGSFATAVKTKPGVRVGDLSATLINNINPLVNLVRVPSKRIALMEDWRKKLPLLAQASVGKNISNISGVPSWFLTVLKEVLAITGRDSIKQVWPGLEVFFHGGISFDPYRAQYLDIIGHPGINYVETYNASEGFFAVQDDPAVKAMLLILDAGVFYEFEELDTHIVRAPWQVEQGRIYSLIITACNGLWRFPIGDTVKIASLSPLRITIAGRTKHFINAFGEELMVYNADAALARACAIHHCKVLNYTAAPQFLSGSRANGRHQWLIEWATQPASIDEFAATLDTLLQQENSDYEAKRQGNIFLSPLIVTSASPGQFDRWLASTGKLGGQRKVPRLCNDRRFIDPILNID